MGENYWTKIPLGENSWAKMVLDQNSTGENSWTKIPQTKKGIALRETQGLCIGSGGSFPVILEEGEIEGYVSFHTIQDRKLAENSSAFAFPLGTEWHNVLNKPEANKKFIHITIALQSQAYCTEVYIGLSTIITYLMSWGGKLRRRDQS